MVKAEGKAHQDVLEGKDCHRSATRDHRVHCRKLELAIGLLKRLNEKRFRIAIEALRCSKKILLHFPHDKLRNEFAIHTMSIIHAEQRSLLVFIEWVCDEATVLIDLIVCPAVASRLQTVTRQGAYFSMTNTACPQLVKLCRSGLFWHMLWAHKGAPARFGIGDWRLGKLWATIRLLPLRRHRRRRSAAHGRRCENGTKLENLSFRVAFASKVALTLLFCCAPEGCARGPNERWISITLAKISTQEDYPYKPYSTLQYPA